LPARPTVLPHRSNATPTPAARVELGRLEHTRLEARRELLSVEVFADEDEAVDARHVLVRVRVRGRGRGRARVRGRGRGRGTVRVRITPHGSMNSPWNIMCTPWLGVGVGVWGRCRCRCRCRGRGRGRTRLGTSCARPGRGAKVVSE